MNDSMLEESRKIETTDDIAGFCESGTLNETAEQKIANTTEGDGLSKKGKKRLLRQQALEIHYQQLKKAKKERSKEKNKENNKNTRSFRFGDNKTDSLPPSEGENRALAISRSERKEFLKQQFLSNCEKNFKVIIDLNWEEHHTEKAIKSLRQQIMYCYGNNKQHNNPALVHLTGLGPLMSVALIAQNHAENWIGMNMTTDEYLNLPEYSIVYDEDVKSGGKKQLVYLTSDAKETLDTLDVNCAYIIGGIVDRNSLKGITNKKADAQGIRTAKLPIKENYSLAATHILTVNHVFEILLNYASFGNWTKAMETVLPQRKNVKLKEDNKNAKEEMDSDAKGDLNLVEKSKATNAFVYSSENCEEANSSEVLKQNYVKEE